MRSIRTLGALALVLSLAAPALAGQPRGRAVPRGAAPAGPVRGVAVARPVARPPVGGAPYRHYGPYYRGYPLYGYPYHGYPYYGYPYYGGYGYGYPGFSVGVSIGYGYPYGAVYGSYGYPYAYPAYPYPAYGGYVVAGRPYGGVRIDLPQRDAEVFVDGYFAGVVDNFDGNFQQLNLEPGGHKIEVRAPGFDSLSLDVNVSPGQTMTIRGPLQAARP